MKKLQITTECLKLSILFIFILFGIFSFLIIEFIMQIKPCKLCTFQRIPYYLSAFFCLLGFTRIISAKYIIWLIILSFFTALCIAIFHILVEEGIVGFTCTIEYAYDLESLKKQAYSAPNCSSKSKIFGIRITVISAIYDIFLIILSGFLLFYGKLKSNNKANYITYD